MLVVVVAVVVVGYACRAGATVVRARHTCEVNRLLPLAVLPCQIISNYTSTIGLVVLLGMHPVLWLVWLGFRLCQTYEAHSGYGC